MSKYVRAIHRHNSTHWNGGIETRYTPHHGWALYYFQTGDMRIFDIFKNELSQYLVQNPVDVWYADYGSRLYYHMRFWEMTNDPDYRDRIEWFLKETLKVLRSLQSILLWNSIICLLDGILIFFNYSS